MTSPKIVLQCGLSLLLSVAIVSCNDIGRNDFDKMLSELDVSEFSRETQYVIIIPGQGCSSCLSAAREFLNKNFLDESFVFILTKYDSQNQLRRIYGTEVLKSTILDRFDILYNGGFNSMYPAIVSVANGSSFQIRLADPNHYDLWNEILK